MQAGWSLTSPPIWEIRSKHGIPASFFLIKKDIRPRNSFRRGCLFYKGKHYCFLNSILYQLKNNFHCSVTFSLSDLYDTGITTVTICIFWCNLCKQLVCNVFFCNKSHYKALIVKIGAEETKVAIDGLSTVTRKLAQCLDEGG